MDEGGPDAREDPAPAAGSLEWAEIDVPASGPQADPGAGGSLVETLGGLAGRARANAARQPAWLLVGLTALLAAPKAWHLWTSEAIFSLGFLVAPWAIAWTATRPPAGASAAGQARRAVPAGARWGLLAASIGLALAGWYYALAWAAIWAMAAALALVALEEGLLPRGLVPAGLVVLTAPPPFFDALMLEARHAVTVASQHLLGLAGIPVVRDALTLSTPNFVFSVEPQCVGMSSLLATIALLGMLSTHGRTPLRRLGLGVLVGIAASLSFNLVRVLAVVASAEWYGPVLVDGAFHGGASMALGLAAVAVAVPALGSEHLLAGPPEAGGAEGTSEEEAGGADGEGEA